jgi:hypothetical protein
MDNAAEVSSRSGQPEIDPELHDVAHFVHEEFDGRVDPQVVDDCLNKVTARFAGAPVRVFVPLLVRRYTREEMASSIGRRNTVLILRCCVCGRSRN